MVMSHSDPLSHIDVVDLTEDYNSYTGKLFSDMGARVTKIEPPGGDPARSTPPFATDEGDMQSSAFFGFLNTGKRSIVLDPTNTEDRNLVRRLCGSVDVVIEDRLDAYGIDIGDLRDAHPDLVVVSLSGFGRTDSNDSRENADIVAAAMGGMMYQTGYPNRPPTRPGMSACSSLGAVYAAVGALLGVYARETVGGQHVDVSHQEVIAASLESTPQKYIYSGEIETRNGNRHMGGHPYGEIYSTSDGYVCISLAGTPTEGPMGGQDMSMWEPFCELIDRPDLLEDERFNALPDDDLTGPDKRLEHADELDAILEAVLSENWESEELFESCQENGIAATLVASVDEILNSEQLEGREFFEDVALPNGRSITMPTDPFVFANASCDPTRAPRLDEHAETIRDELSGDSDRKSREPEHGTDHGDGMESRDDDQAGDPPTPWATETKESAPLEGVRVLDFTMAWAGPTCTRILADHGADVIKVESKGHFDISRGMGPFWEQTRGDPAHGEDRSGYFQVENRNKRSLAIDLGAEEGVELIRELVESGEIDVVVESFSPGVMDRLGLGYEDLETLDEELVMCSLSGYGQEGPESSYRAYGTVLEPYAGLAQLTGFPEDDPVRTGISFSDPLAGALGAFAIIASLVRRGDDSGEYIDISQREAGVVLIHQALSAYDLTGDTMTRIGNRDERRRIVQGCYACTDGDLLPEEESWVVIALRDENDWQGFCELFDDLEWTNDERFESHEKRLQHHDALDERIAAATVQCERRTLVEQLQARGVPAGVVQNTRDLVDRDDTLAARNFWERVDHPVIPDQLYPTVLPRLSETPGWIRQPAPMLGQHSREVLYELLDATGNRIEALETDAILQ